MKRMIPRTPLAVLALGALCLAACQPSNKLKGTALYVVMSFPDVAVDQFSLSAANASGLIVQPTLRPDPASSQTLTSPQSVHMLLTSADEGQATVFVDALFEGKVVAQGSASAAVTLGVENQVQVTLAQGGGCGECQGCCQDGTCVTTLTVEACGAGGSTCLACGVAADSCTGGTCACGGSNPCQSGQQCVGGVCQCTPQSCPTGCCTTDGHCLQVDSTSQGTLNCGTAGLTCETCHGGGVNTCTSGVCVETCNVTNCQGCCSGDTCVRPQDRTFLKCGAGGDACEVCDAVHADSCGNAGCQCGSNPPCASGKSCHAGACS